MAVEVQVPVGGEGADDYVLLRWYAAEGDWVNDGDALFEIETAKATYDVPASADGLLTIAVAEGLDVSAHQVVGRIETAVAVPSEDEALPPRPGLAQSEPAQPQQGEHSVARPSRATASPRARVAARAAVADLVATAGTGPGGRVLARDLPSPPARHDRAVIARRMTEAAAIPTVTLHRWCDGTALRHMIAGLRAHEVRLDLPRISVGHVVAAVVARVLTRHPDLNAHWVDGVRRNDSVHLGIAVDAPWGLVVPVVRDAQRLSVGALSTTLADLAERARTRTVGGEEITGSTFTITNLGPTGVEHFTPLLNLPEVAILGVGALGSASLRGNPGDGTVQLPLSLTFDHRAVDGAPAGRFLADVAAGIEAADIVLTLGDGGRDERHAREARPRP